MKVLEDEWYAVIKAYTFWQFGDFLVWYFHNASCPTMSLVGHEHSEMNGTLL